MTNQSQILSTAEHEYLKHKRYQQLVTGFECLDSQRGITTEDFVVMGGGTGTGKSLIALFMACSMAKKGETVIFLNAENSKKVTSDRIREFGFDFDKDFGIPDAKGFHRLIIISIKDIRFESIPQFFTIYKPTAMFIDLFSSLLDHVESHLKTSFTGKYAKELSFYPEKYNCAIIVTEQLTKDSRRVGRATPDDIAGGAALTRKATKIITLYRYAKEKLDTLVAKAVKNKVTGSGQIMLSGSELIVRKDRLGFWKDGINLIKYEHGEGFISPEGYEMTDYFNTVFGNQIGGAK